MILAGGKRRNVFAIDHDNERRFFTVEEFLDNHTATGFTKGVTSQHVFNGVFGFFQGHGNNNTFTRSKAVGLHYDRRAFFTNVSQRWFNLGEVLVIGGWDLVAGQEILGEGFRAFQLCSAFAWPEDFKTFSLKRIYHTYYQWRFRTNYGESDSVIFGKCHQCFYVSR